MTQQAQAPEVNPLLAMALGFVQMRPLEERTRWAEQVCDTLGAYPKMFREAPETPPVNVGCVVRVGHSSPPCYSIAAYDGARWLWNDQPIADVTAWAALPA
jgi:hypothetical protein